MNPPDGCGRVTGECGDTMEIYFKFENNRVSKTTCFTYRCASSMVGGSFLARTVQEDLTHYMSGLVTKAKE